MATVAVSSINHLNASKYLAALSQGAEPRLVTPRSNAPSNDALLDQVGGLMLTGGPDVDPAIYGHEPDHQAGLELDQELDEMETALLLGALERDMPVLAICRGMQLLNVAFGGSLLQDIPGHRSEHKDGHEIAGRHSVYLSPGSKLAAILGMGGFFHVNSLHHQGFRDAQRSPRLLTSAYSLDDGIVEGLESTEHSWVVGVQCHPERADEVPGVFRNLFTAFMERADMWQSGRLH